MKAVAGLAGSDGLVRLKGVARVARLAVGQIWDGDVCTGFGLRNIVALLAIEGAVLAMGKARFRQPMIGNGNRRNRPTFRIPCSRSHHLMAGKTGALFHHLGDDSLRFLVHPCDVFDRAAGGAVAAARTAGFRLIDGLAKQGGLGIELIDRGNHVCNIAVRYLSRRCFGFELERMTFLAVRFHADRLEAGRGFIRRVAVLACELLLASRATHPFGGKVDVVRKFQV